MQPGAVKRFADIDVAETGNQPLIEESGLQRRDLVAEEERQTLRAHGLAQWLDPHRGEMLTASEVQGRHEVHEAEAARIVIGDGGAVRHRHHHMVVLGVAERSFEIEISGRDVTTIRQGHVEAPAHAEMQDQRLSRVETGGEVFRPSRQIGHRSAFEPLGEALGEGKPQVRPAQGHAGESCTHHGGGKPATDGFDFGQFWHGGGEALDRGTAPT